MNPVVSVIIPAYNTGSYIRRAIDSALNQTLIELEVIVVDDCSTDNTVEIVKGYTDERVKLLQNSQNSGAAVARNRALDIATGQWIAILDSDDWYAPDRLERLVALAKANNADLISDDLYLIADGEQTPWGTLLGESGESISHILKIAPIILLIPMLKVVRVCASVFLNHYSIAISSNATSSDTMPPWPSAKTFGYI